MTAPAHAAAAPDPVNEVLLVGRIAAEPQSRVLPSGTALTTFRIVVGRPPPPRRAEGPRQPSVDSLDCAAWAPKPRRIAESLEVDDMVEVRGALRRRFWRSPGGGPASRCEVEVTTIRRVRRAG
jgi:single-strand DNA-binding protein